jgi:hypothetical protein
LAPGTGYQALRGPLRGLNVLSCEGAGQLHQLVTELGEALGIRAESPAVYQRHVDAILYSGQSREGRGPSPQVGLTQSGAAAAEVDPNGGSTSPEDEYSGVELVIRRHCEREWPEDYNMRSFCIKQQREALNALKQGLPDGIPEEVFAGIRDKCAEEWPEDYNLRRYHEEQQFDSYLELEGGSQ